MRIVSADVLGSGGERRVTWWYVCALFLGLYLSLRGYHSLDGDQAYRLPLLLHRQEPRLYEDDPFVRSLDAFNPHRGSLIVLDVITRPLGLPAGLFLLFSLTFGLTCRGVERLTRAVWPTSGPTVGWIAVGLFMSAKAGNIGTNHLFEGMLLDRLIALAMGWFALAHSVIHPEERRWWPPLAIGLATWIHPSLGLQLAMVLAASWVAWSLLGGKWDVPVPVAARSLIALTLAVLPGLAINLPRETSLSGDLPGDVFWLLSVELQSPQHMLPHLWRMPQWLSWTCYLALATLQLGRFPGAREDGSGIEVDQGRRPSHWPPARRRLAVSMAIILIGLAVAWFAIEVLHQVRVTIFQPFRMATLARGIALILVAERLPMLWKSSRPLGRFRAILLATGFLGDWLLIVVTAAEMTISALELCLAGWRFSRRVQVCVFLAVLAYGLNFLLHHDTESGNRPLLIAVVVGLSIEIEGHWRRRDGTRLARSRLRNARWAMCAMTAAWLIPAGSLMAAVALVNHPARRSPILMGLIDRCRFLPVPIDDIERLALWCREHTPATARFIGPPGPKTFRLWARRSVAFNRAASPYHAQGLADWFARFQEHVDFHATPAEFVRAYLPNRHRFESRYDALSDDGLASLAIRQGATYVIAAANATVREKPGPDSALERLHAEGRYAIYRVRATELVHRHR